MAEHVPSVCVAPGLTPSSEKQKQRDRERDRDRQRQRQRTTKTGGDGWKQTETERDKGSDRGTEKQRNESDPSNLQCYFMIGIITTNSWFLEQSIVIYRIDGNKVKGLTYGAITLIKWGSIYPWNTVMRVDAGRYKDSRNIKGLESNKFGDCFIWFKYNINLTV